MTGEQQNSTTLDQVGVRTIKRRNSNEQIRQHTVKKLTCLLVIGMLRSLLHIYRTRVVQPGSTFYVL